MPKNLIDPFGLEPEHYAVADGCRQTLAERVRFRRFAIINDGLTEERFVFLSLQNLESRNLEIFDSHPVCMINVSDIKRSPEVDHEIRLAGEQSFGSQSFSSLEAYGALGR